MMGFLHLYLVHVSGWACFLVASDVVKNGLPRIGTNDWTGFLIAVPIALVMGLISSHAHSHYLTYLVGK